MLERARPARPIAVYLKFDTGMSRLGFGAGEAAAVRARVAALPHVRVAALMTHFANADRAQAAPVDEQLAAFRSLAPDWSGDTSMSNSAALFLQPHPGDSAVRPGIALYGGAPSPGVAAAGLGLRAAMRLQAELIAVREVAAGAAVGYGSRWVAPRRSRIGVVACGYADGYPRGAPDGTPAWVAGRRVGLAGRVSMDMLTIDLTEVDAARPGTVVELWGEHVPVDEVAGLAGTVGYELLCALTARVPVREEAD
jgi:alanine racemase